MCLLYRLSQPLASLCWKQLANTPKRALVTSEGTMTGAQAPFGVHLRICQLYMSRNGSLVMPCVPCARAKPLRLVILALRLCLGLPGHLCPAVPQARGHAWPLRHGFPVLNETNDQLRMCTHIELRCCFQCFYAGSVESKGSV